MSDVPPNTHEQSDDRARPSNDMPYTSVLDQVHDDAKRGLEDPLSLAPLEIKRICYAVAAVLSGRARP